MEYADREGNEMHPDAPDTLIIRPWRKQAAINFYKSFFFFAYDTLIWLKILNSITRYVCDGSAQHFGLPKMDIALTWESEDSLILTLHSAMGPCSGGVTVPYIKGATEAICIVLYLL